MICKQIRSVGQQRQLYQILSTARTPSHLCIMHIVCHFWASGHKESAHKGSQFWLVHADSGWHQAISNGGGEVRETKIYPANTG